VRGGNVFMLRYALYRAGGDTILAGALQRDALVYAGYSAGPYVLAPSLRGLEAVDDAGAVPRIYGASPVWVGLGVLGFSIVPHCQSPGHPENAACEQVASRYEAAGIPHRTLRDGQALIIDGDNVAISGH
jgi:dipeptidase E